jgi:hypothetical protein
MTDSMPNLSFVLQASHDESLEAIFQGSFSNFCATVASAIPDLFCTENKKKNEITPPH